MTIKEIIAMGEHTKRTNATIWNADHEAQLQCIKDASRELDALRAELARARADGWLATQWMREDDFADKERSRDITIERMNSPFYEGERYAVRWGRSCLNASSEWEYEPSPSSRDDAFYERCRFKTFADATKAADAARAKGEGK